MSKWAFCDKTEFTMGIVLSTFLDDYNRNFSYSIPLDDSSDEQFTPILSRIDVEIITISSSESDTDWKVRTKILWTFRKTVKT